jgi:hypothetical protein
MRFGSWRTVVAKARDSFIRQAVDEVGYRATEAAAFLGCHPSNITWVWQTT